MLAAVLAAVLAVAVVDLARTDRPGAAHWSLVGTAGALVGAVYAERQVNDRFGAGSWTFPQLVAYLAV